MNFRFTPRGEAEADKKQGWWRQNRPAAADLFDDELAAILNQITKRPTLGTIYPSAFDAVVRRVLMARTKNPCVLRPSRGRDRRPFHLGRSSKTRPKAMIAPNLIPTLQGAAFDRALALARLKAKLATITGRGFALPVIDPR